MLPIILAVAGMILILLGSFVTVLVPEEGKREMIMLPSYLGGGICGLIALILADTGTRPVQITAWSLLWNRGPCGDAERRSRLLVGA